MNMVRKIKSALHELKQIKQSNLDTRLLVGSLLAKNIDSVDSIKDAEFKVFSQCGDDGIIQFLIKKLAISNDQFVEFGVETYEEANTRFLLLNNNWRGLIIDGSKDNIDFIKKDSIYWKHEVNAVHSFITAENINQTLLDNGLKGRIGILSIDIDGNDYWVWRAINAIEADIVIIEYNSMFGANRSITVPYNASFSRMVKHHSGLYFGASLKALCDLGKTKDYSFIGCNQAGNNAYFIKDDHLPHKNLKVLTPEEGYVKSRFREARNHSKQLTYANFEDRSREIIGLPVFNIRTGATELI